MRIFRTPTLVSEHHTLLERCAEGPPIQPMTKEWNATLYHQVSAPQVSWGKKVLGRVFLRGDKP